MGLPAVSLDDKYSRDAGRIYLTGTQALADFGLDAAVLSAIGIRILKVAMPFPVDRETYREFAQGPKEVLVIEDKREQIENAIRNVCYALPEGRRTRSGHGPW